jgi:hypothetical protein
VGGLIIASDGIYNDGINPVYAAEKLDFPVYCIALGDTSIKKDIRIEKVFHNEIVFAGNSFPVEVNIAAEKAKEENILLNVYRKNRNVYSESIKVTGDDEIVSKKFRVPAEGTGTQQYRLEISMDGSEPNTENNDAVIFIATCHLFNRQR